MFNLDELGAKRGLAVEGIDDETILSAFLDAGEEAGLWTNWGDHILVLSPLGNRGGVSEVKKEIDKPENEGIIWGLIDRDWQTEAEIEDLQKQHPHLLVLPRIMIENYFIDADDLMNVIPTALIKNGEEERLRAAIEEQRDDWVYHGALTQILVEKGARKFCSGAEGYPGALLGRPITDENIIASKLKEFQDQLNPSEILVETRTRAAGFLGKRDAYRYCINGKMFFNQVVVGVLNFIFKKNADRSEWIDEFFEASVPRQCPEDLVPVLQVLFAEE